MFDNPTDNHTDIEVPLYYKLRFTKLKIADHSDVVWALPVYIFIPDLRGLWAIDFRKDCSL